MKLSAFTGVPSWKVHPSLSVTVYFVESVVSTDLATANSVEASSGL